MNPGILLIILALAIGVAVYGLRRIHIPRQAGFEAIEALEIAEAYNRISRWPQFRVLRLIIARELASHGPSGILADIGCGPGYLATLIAQRHADLEVLGLDASDEMVKAAESQAATLGLSDRVGFRRGDAADLPLSDGALDFAVSTMSLHHWSDPRRGLAEIHRALKPGGQLLLFDLRRDSRRFVLWLLRFATGVVVPAALRRAHEPLGSLQASYSLPEAQALMAESQFKECAIDGRSAWVFIWARKASQEAAHHPARS